jgi:hypothetical protein
MPYSALASLSFETFFYMRAQEATNQYIQPYAFCFPDLRSQNACGMTLRPWSSFLCFNCFRKCMFPINILFPTFSKAFTKIRERDLLSNLQNFDEMNVELDSGLRAAMN